MSTASLAADLMDFVTAHARRAGPLAGLRRLLASRAFLSAEFCRILAPHKGLPAEEAFVCGLAHDVGALMAVRAVETQVQARPVPSSRTLDEWLETVHDCHIELGLRVAHTWDMPEMVVECIRYHHADSAEGPEVSPMTELVMASDAVLTLADAEPSVTLDMISAVPYLETDDQQVWAMVALTQLPIGASLFADDEAPGQVPTCAVQPKQTATRNPLYPTNFPVATGAGFAQTYRAWCVSTDALCIMGAHPLPEYGLFKVRIEPTTMASFDMWGAVTRCSPHAGGYDLELAPVGLDDLSVARWNALVRGARDAGREAAAPIPAPRAAAVASPVTAAEKPAAARKPASAKKPTAAKRPAAAGKPAAAKIPAAAGKSAAAKIPAAAGKSADPKKSAAGKSAAGKSADPKKVGKSKQAVAGAALKQVSAISPVAKPSPSPASENAATSVAARQVSAISPAASSSVAEWGDELTAIDLGWTQKFAAVSE